MKLIRYSHRLFGGKGHVSCFCVRQGLQAVFVFTLFSLLSCQSSPPARVVVSDEVETEVRPPLVRDSGPKAPLDVSHIPDAYPVVEPRPKLGNKSPYEVDGITYYIVQNIKGFEQVGDASWYGQKFHGQRTSNGELYDMYGMTAAHKTLPIPCFVEVTNLSNGKKVILRVNDRGPFHSNRIIDLTYTAARKLGYDQTGTAKVKLRVIEPNPKAKYAGLGQATPARPGVAPKPRNSGGYEIPPNTYIQLAAFGDINRANTYKLSVQHLSSYPTVVKHVAKRNVYRVLIGPLKDNWDLVQLQLSLERQGYQAKTIYHQP